MAEKKVWDKWARENGKHIALTNKKEWTEEEFNERGTPRYRSIRYSLSEGSWS